MALLTAFDGRNLAASFEAVEFKCLMAVLGAAILVDDGIILKIASEVIKRDGFAISDKDIESYIKHNVLIFRNLLSQISNKPDEEEMPIAPIPPHMVN